MTGLESLKARMSPLPEGRLLIGLSGGADSVALLLTALLDPDRNGTNLCAVHVNHGLRGGESDADEAFVRTLCQEKGIPLEIRRPDLGGRRDENAAREARMACFRRIMADTGAGALLLAHNRDDRAETFLMRLLRGSGTEGLACMGETETRMGFRILRPMLSLGREEIRTALREDGIPWREDSSNEDERYLRNAVRKKLIPLMNSLAPGASARIAHTASLAQADQEVLQTLAERALDGRESRSWMSADVLLEQPEAVRSRMLRSWWRAQGPALRERELNGETTGKLAALTERPDGTVNLPAGYRCVKNGGFLHLIPPERNVPEPAEWREPVTEFGGLTLRQEPSAGNPGDGKTCQEVPAGFAEGCVLRTRRPGDRIRPFGCAGSRKLQDYLTDRKIGEPWRDQIPLLCRGTEVILAAGVGAGAIPEWNREGHNVRLLWQGEMPWMREAGRTV